MLNVATTYAAELDTLKAWIALRLEWLDNNIPGVCSPTSLEAGPERNTSTVYPNPSAGLFHFTTPLMMSEPILFTVRDMTGRVVDSRYLQSGRSSFDHTIEGSGTYFFTLETSDRIVHQGRLIVL